MKISTLESEKKQGLAKAIIDYFFINPNNLGTTSCPTKQ